MSGSLTPPPADSCEPPHAVIMPAASTTVSTASRIFFRVFMVVIPFLSFILISILAFYHKYAKITARVLKPGRLLSYFFLQRQNLIEAF
jgi:hypothetical protein